MVRKTGITLNLDMAAMSMVNGTAKSICPGGPAEYVTVVDFILDAQPSDQYLGNFEAKLAEGTVQVHLRRIANESDDPLLQVGRDWNFGVSGTGVPQLPFRAFTDNRGRYPCVLVRIVFPFRLGSWIDPSHETGMRMDYDYGSIQITGWPQSEDKISALKALHAISAGWPSEYRPSYDDVTIYSQLYYRKGEKAPLVLRLTALDSRTAYRDAVEDFFFGTAGATKLQASIEERAPKAQAASIKIQSEADLLDFVRTQALSVLEHHIHKRRWIEPFWDGNRTIDYEGTKLAVPKSPKSETDIQPTLHVILEMALARYGIHVVRETDEGVGALDFRCLFTTESGTPVTIGIEFKLAHHKRIKKGIESQLPAYLAAIKSHSGIFAVMWFKDFNDRYFTEPSNRVLSDFKTWLVQEAEQVSKDQSLFVHPIVLDASIRPSASQFDDA